MTRIEDLSNTLSSLSITSNSFNESDPDFTLSNTEKALLTPARKTVLLPNNLSEVSFAPICETAHRFGLSAAGAAMMTNAVFESLGLITDDCKGLVVSKNYMHAPITQSLSKQWNVSDKTRKQNVDKIRCFSFDGKKSQTAVLMANATDVRQKIEFVSMENVAIVSQPDMERVSAGESSGLSVIGHNGLEFIMH